MNFSKNIDLLPDYRRNHNTSLKEFIESFMTESRKEALFKVLKQRTKYLTIIAENLIDEHNIHAIIRSSECFGLQDFHTISKPNVLLKKGKSVNRGSFQWTHIYDYTDNEEPTLSCIQHLKSNGYTVYGTSSHLPSSYTPQTIPIDKPLAIMVGKEHGGLSDTALQHCDGLISIPMYGFTESFNVSVAASLLIQPIIERIKAANIDWQLSDEEKHNLYYEWIWYNVKQPDKLYKQWLTNNSKNQ